MRGVLVRIVDARARLSSVVAYVGRVRQLSHQRVPRTDRFRDGDGRADRRGHPALTISD